MFVPYFLFSNVKFNGTVPPFEYHNFLAPRIKGYPTSTHHTCSHKKTQDRLTIPGPYLQNTPKQILSSIFPQYSSNLPIILLIKENIPSLKINQPPSFNFHIKEISINATLLQIGKPHLIPNSLHLRILTNPSSFKVSTFTITFLL